MFEECKFKTFFDSIHTRMSLTVFGYKGIGKIISTFSLLNIRSTRRFSTSYYEISRRRTLPLMQIPGLTTKNSRDQNASLKIYDSSSFKCTTSLNNLTLPNITPFKKLELPSFTANYFVEYNECPTAKIQTISDPLTKDYIIKDVPFSGRASKKQAAHLIQIRKRKMRKHKLKKLRKRMRFVFAKIEHRRTVRKENAFRAELLSQIKEAEDFDAEKYVNKILLRIRNKPRPETPEEVRERILELSRQNKSNTVFLPPKLDDY